MGASGLIITVAKLAVALASIVGISAGLSYYHGFTLKKKNKQFPQHPSNFEGRKKNVLHD